MGLSVISSPLEHQENIKMVQMEGKYLRTEEKDYEKFLSAVGVGFMYRKAATASTPTMTITKSGDKWTMETATTLKTRPRTAATSRAPSPRRETTSCSRSRCPGTPR